MAAAYATLSPQAVPRATSALNVIQRVGGSLGTALLAVLLQSKIAGLPGAAAEGGGIGRLPEGVRERIADPLAGAFSDTFWWAVGMSALALIPAVILARSERRERRESAPAQDAAAAAPAHAA
jgi:hypothetical protein